MHAHSHAREPVCSNRPKPDTVFCSWGREVGSDGIFRRLEREVRAAGDFTLDDGGARVRERATGAARAKHGAVVGEKCKERATLHAKAEEARESDFRPALEREREAPF